MSLFLDFASLNDRVAATTKKLEKRALIAGYLRSLPREDAERAALWLSGTPFAEIDARVLNVGGSLLAKAIAQLAVADPHLLGAAYRRHGDLGAATADLLSHASHAPSVATLTLANVALILGLLADARGPAAKLRLLLDVLAQATPVEAKYFIKLVTGDMRTGVKQALVEEAIAEAWSAELPAVRRASMLLGDLPEVVRLTAEGRLGEAQMRLFHPLGFMLASPVQSVEEAVARFADEVRAERAESVTPESPAVVREGQLENKYDGIRAQLHVEPGSGRVAIFSRNREDLSAAFPELIEAFAGIGESAILDGEVLAWNPDSARALPFAALQQRLGRKRVTAEMRREIPVVLVAFDLLCRGDSLLLEQPLAMRRRMLEEFTAQWSDATAKGEISGQTSLFDSTPRGFARLILAPAKRLESATQLDQAYVEARSRGNEGVMIKSLASTYQPGRRGLAWLKLKRELATLDVVVTGVEYGNGRRAQVLSDYTFAIRDTDDPTQPLKNVGKAYSGLTDQEIATMTTFFQEHTLEDLGHFRTVEPVVVLEVAFNNVMRSSRHVSGFALRFPRIVRIRSDKPVAEIDTLRRVEEIYNGQPDKPLEEDQ